MIYPSSTQPMMTEVPESKSNHYTTEEVAKDHDLMRQAMLRMAKSKAQLVLMKKMTVDNVGVRQVEGAEKRLRKSKKGPRREKRDARLVTDLMRSKVRDARDCVKEAEIKLKEAHRRINDKYGRNSRTVNKLVRKCQF